MIIQLYDLRIVGPKETNQLNLHFVMRATLEIIEDYLEQISERHGSFGMTLENREQARHALRTDKLGIIILGDDTYYISKATHILAPSILSKRGDQK